MGIDNKKILKNNRISKLGRHAKNRFGEVFKIGDLIKDCNNEDEGIILNFDTSLGEQKILARTTIGDCHIDSLDKIY